MVENFIYNGLPARVLFGSGTITQTAAEIRSLGCKRALVLSTPQQEIAARNLAAQLGELSAGLFAGATMHTPVAVTMTALEALGRASADCLVAIGGGSTIGLGKALALRTDLPQLVIPTTYAGSEATPILGETQDGRKVTQRDMKVLPEVILYDVDLTLTLPPSLSASSGMNAIAHAVEALYAQDANPIISLMAEAAIAALAHSLPAIVENPSDKAARSDALYGAWLCGTCLGSVGMALHHKLCHILGGTFNLPHAETHAVLLPYAVAYNEAAAPAAMLRLARALGVSRPALGLQELATRLKVPSSLQALGMPESGIDQAADLALTNPYWNPRPLERIAIRALLDDAWHGRPVAGG